MTRRKAGATRRENTEKVEKSQTAMDSKEADLKLHASDLEQERRTRESLELAGAEEDAHRVEDSIERAESISAERFGAEDQELERLQGSNEALEKDFERDVASNEKDLAKIDGVKLEGSEASQALLLAKEAVINGRDFLREQTELIRRAGEASEKAQKVFEDMVHAIRGKR